VSQSLIEPLSLEESKQAAEAVEVPAALAELNVFRVLLRRPRVAKAISDLLLSLLFGGKLDDRLREFVIMRIGWATGSNYEWTQHWRIAQDQFGCTAEELLALKDWRSSGLFGDAERAVLAATDETLETGRVSRETFALCREHVGGDDECLELTAALGAWRLISQLARTIEFPLEEGVADWPPDGAPSPGDR
jgi:alkylhydroperoxidase family enzyme